MIEIPSRDTREARADPAPPPAPRKRRLRSPIGIAYVDGLRLRRSILVGVEHVARQRAELNRINVFPVPDGDTGTNLALTLRSIADAVRPSRSRSVSEVAGLAAEASVLGARGNSGMLFSHFLVGFARNLGHRLRVGTAEMAEALSAAAGTLHGVLEHPREGTIITVARDFAAEARRRARVCKDLSLWLSDLQVVAERSLQRTRELLPVLREAGVVDAGAKGFVFFFEGMLHYIEGRTELAEGSPRELDQHELPSLYLAREAGIGADEGRYCTQIAVRGSPLPDEAEIRRRLAGMGTSTIVLRAGDLAKVHIHSDQPEDVVTLLADLGEVVSERIEDTLLVGTVKRVAVITDSSADLPQDWVERHGVTVVPLQVIVGDRIYRDGVDLDSERLAEILDTPGLPLPTTSQPTPHDFTERYQRARERGAEELLGIFVSSVLSGTYASASEAMRRLDGVKGASIDSRSGSLGVGLLVARAVELLDEDMGLEELAAELRRVRDQSNIFLTVDRFDCLLRSGRVGRMRAWIGGLLDYKPILTLGDDGRIVAAGKVRGKEALVEHVLELLDKALAGADRYRLGVVHFRAPEVARTLVAELAARYAPVEILSGPTAAALAVHTGVGAWAVAYQIED